MSRWQNVARSHIVGSVGNCLPLGNENKVRHYIYTQRTSIIK
jgi:hypothetical protein